MASEIQVDTILPQSSSTLTLGNAGSTVNVTGTLDGSGLTGINADNITSGTLPDARFPATLPAISGANLTNLDASDLASGTIPDARFPAVLPAIDGSNLTGITQTTINNNADNRVITGSATANTLEAESGLTYNGSTLAVTGGASFTADVTLGDNDTLRLGTGGDLTLGHDGSHSYITDLGTGNLYIRASNDLFLTNADTTKAYFRGTNAGASTLYYNNSQKFTTSSTGVSVTGTVSATAFSGDGSALTNLPASTPADGSITYAKLSTSTTESLNVSKRVAKVWVNFNQTTIRTDFNVSSITSLGGAEYRVNFSSALSANYCALGTSNSTTILRALQVHSINTGNCTAVAVAENGIAYPIDGYSVACFI